MIFPFVNIFDVVQYAYPDFYLSKFTSLLHVAQHNQKWFMMDLIHGRSLEQHFFLAAFNKCFSMFLQNAKGQIDVEYLSGFFSKRILLACACLLLEKKY